MKNVGVFVNSSLLFYVVQSQFRQSHPSARIDYRAYLEQAVGSERLYRAFAYGAQIENEAAGFVGCLQQTGFETRYVPAKQVNGKHHVLDTDRNMDLAMDAIRLVDRLDTAVIGSNDANLIPLVKYLRERGLKVIVFATRVPRELVRAANEVTEITEAILEHAHHPATT